MLTFHERYGSRDCPIPYQDSNIINGREDEPRQMSARSTPEFGLPPADTSRPQCSRRLREPAKYYFTRDIIAANPDSVRRARVYSAGTR